jgi:hypothetical protein
MPACRYTGLAAYDEKEFCGSNAMKVLLIGEAGQKMTDEKKPHQADVAGAK